MISTQSFDDTAPVEYRTGSANSVVSNPSIIEFADFRLNKTYKLNVQLLNRSATRIRLTVKPAKIPEIKVNHRRKGTLITGMWEQIEVIFTPRQWQTIQTEIEVQSSAGDTLKIPFQAFPSRNLFDFPKILDVGRVTMGEGTTIKQVVRNVGPTNVSFHVSTDQLPDWITVTPTRGILAGLDGCEITIGVFPRDPGRFSYKLRIGSHMKNAGSAICKINGESIAAHSNITISSLSIHEQQVSDSDSGDERSRKNQTESRSVASKNSRKSRNSTRDRSPSPETVEQRKRTQLASFIEACSKHEAFEKKKAVHRFICIGEEIPNDQVRESTPQESRRKKDCLTVSHKPIIHDKEIALDLQPTFTFLPSDVDWTAKSLALKKFQQIARGILLKIRTEMQTKKKKKTSLTNIAHKARSTTDDAALKILDTFPTGFRPLLLPDIEAALPFVESTVPIPCDPLPIPVQYERKPIKTTPVSPFIVMGYNPLYPAHHQSNRRIFAYRPKNTTDLPQSDAKKTAPPAPIETQSVKKSESGGSKTGEATTTVAPATPINVMETLKEEEKKPLERIEEAADTVTADGITFNSTPAPKHGAKTSRRRPTELDKITQPSVVLPSPSDATSPIKEDSEGELFKRNASRQSMDLLNRQSVNAPSGALAQTFEPAPYPLVLWEPRMNLNIQPLIHDKTEDTITFNIFYPDGDDRLVLTDYLYKQNPVTEGGHAIKETATTFYEEPDPVFSQARPFTGHQHDSNDSVSDPRHSAINQPSQTLLDRWTLHKPIHHKLNTYINDGADSTHKSQSRPITTATSTLTSTSSAHNSTQKLNSPSKSAKGRRSGKRQPLLADMQEDDVEAGSDDDEDRDEQDADTEGQMSSQRGSHSQLQTSSDGLHDADPE